MDAISYSYADKQAKRIKKFINDPDSTSGVLTVPKVIASGESVTIPAGRVAILPDVQVDGTLNVLGDIFIPTGTANSKVVQKVVSTDKAIPRFNGTTGDIQNSGVIIDNNNNIGIGVTPSAWSTYKAVELGAAGNAILGVTNSTVITNNAIFTSGAWKYSSGAIPNKFEVGNGDGTFRWHTAPVSTAGNTITWTNAMTLDSAGNLRIGSSDTGINNTFITPSGEIQSVNNGIAYTKLKLNPSGGNVLIGTTIDNGLDKLQVAGNISSSGTMTASNYNSIFVNNASWSGTTLTISPLLNGIPAKGLLEFSISLGFNSSNAYAEVSLLVIVNFASGYPSTAFNNSHTVLVNQGRNETAGAPTITVSTSKATSMGSNDGTLILTTSAVFTAQVYSCQIRRLTNPTTY